jgi:hypothetical protein
MVFDDIMVSLLRRKAHEKAHCLNEYHRKLHEREVAWKRLFNLFQANTGGNIVYASHSSKLCSNGGTSVREWT